MERKILSKKIHDISAEVSRLANTLYAMDLTDIQQYPENYDLLSADAALRSERITCRLRNIVYATTTLQKPDYLLDAGERLGIQIDETDGIMEIRMCGLLPKRKSNIKSEFLVDPLRYALAEYAKEHPIPRYGECTVCLAQIYAADFPKGSIRDYDNIEYKQIVDVISSFLLTDDGGLRCDSHCMTEIGETAATRINIMEKSRFPEWFTSRSTPTID